MLVLRRYIWAVNLLTIALCALFAAKATGRLVESFIGAPVSSKKGTLAANPPVAAATPGQRDITNIISRNIFCSACEKVTETPTVAAGGGGGGDQGPVKTSLSLQLIATLVSHENQAWSFAAIHDTSADKTALFAIGAKVPGDAVITDILDRRVMLENAGRTEYLELALEEGAQAEGSTAPQVASSQFRSPEPLPEMEQVAGGIRRSGSNSWEIQRGTLDRLLGDTTLLARSARLVPSVKDGQPNGFTLYGVRRGSLYTLLGMFNGDTINAINGHPITTPDKALEIYTKLRAAGHVTLSFTRKGVTLTHEYNIR
jgi:general secretion pathway protein C